MTKFLQKKKNIAKNMVLSYILNFEPLQKITQSQDQRAKMCDRLNLNIDYKQTHIHMCAYNIYKLLDLFVVK